MAFNGTLLKPLDQQHDLDGEYIDPRGVLFDPRREYPVSLDFDAARIVGAARIERRADGGLVARGHLVGPQPLGAKLAIGISARRITRAGVTTSCDLTGLAITERHVDPDQPFVWVEA